MGTTKELRHQHCAVYADSKADKRSFIKDITAGNPPAGLEWTKKLEGAVFSSISLERFLEEEIIHEAKLLPREREQSLQSMSSGERKKALLQYLLEGKPDFLLLDNPFDNLDTDSQHRLRKQLQDNAGQVILVQLFSRIGDILPFIDHFGELQNGTLHWFRDKKELLTSLGTTDIQFAGQIPEALQPYDYREEVLVQLREVSVSYGERQVLDKVNWTVRKGEFWQLSGKNGSGKTTILSMITGDNPKAYGQDISLFGRKKGSGESVWELKHYIGYFTPAMIDRFRGYHSLENMLISGLTDSIGLYIRPSEAQQRLARAWLKLLGLWEERDLYFHELTRARQRLLMCARAMIKHPLLLILDEPTAGLDETGAALFTALTNKIARESDTAIIYVSHREEAGLDPGKVYVLEEGVHGSRGGIRNK